MLVNELSLIEVDDCLLWILMLLYLISPKKLNDDNDRVSRRIRGKGDTRVYRLGHRRQSNSKSENYSAREGSNLACAKIP